MLDRSDWSLVALAVGAYRDHFGERASAFSLEAWADAMARNGTARMYAGGSTGMGSLARHELADWYAAGGELPPPAPDPASNPS